MIEVNKLKTELKKKLSGHSPHEESSGAGICCCFVSLGKIDSEAPSVGIKCFHDEYDAKTTFRFHNYLSKHPKFKNKVPKVFGKLFKIGDKTCYAAEEVHVGFRSIRSPRLKAKIKAKYRNIIYAKDILAEEISDELKRKFPHYMKIINSFMKDRHSGNYGYREKSPYLVWIDFSI